MQLIRDELYKAEHKHPSYPTDIFKQVTVMDEEAGEVSKACMHYIDEGGSIEDVKKELIQTAAMCVRMLIHLQDESNLAEH